MKTEHFDRPDDKNLATLCSDCFVLILKLRASREFGDVEVLRQRIKTLFEKIERDGRHAGFAFEDIQTAKFGLVAFIDETVVTSDWSQKENWLSNPLQFILFNRFDAGEEFFQKLQELRTNARSNAPVLEVYYYCLALGFKGKYKIHEPERLRSLIDELYRDLRYLTGRDIPALSPHGQRKDEIVDVMTAEIPTWVIAVSAAAIGFFFYLVMTFLINNSADNVIRFIEIII